MLMLNKYVNLNIQIDEHKNANMFMFIIINFTNFFEDNHTFLLRCLRHNLVTSRRVIEKITNRILSNKYNTSLKKYFTKIKNHSYIFCCLISVYIYIYIKLLLC